MTYYAGQVSNVRIDDSRRYPVITAEVATGYEFVQLYQAGALVAEALAVDGQVTFTGAMPGYLDPFFPLAIDEADSGTNYWSDAFPDAEANGNRIKVSLTTTESMKTGWQWRVSIDGTKVYEADIFPGGIGAGGWGVQWGTAWGHGPFGSGWGNSWGANWGHGGAMVLEWISEPQTNGTYTVTVSTIDKAGNVSTAASEDVTITTYARPASDLAVSGYVLGTDTLTLTWTESPDI